MSVVNFNPVYILAEDNQQPKIKQARSFIENFLFWVPLVQIVVICFIAYNYLFHELIFISKKYIAPIREGKKVNVNYEDMNKILKSGALTCDGDFLNWSINGLSDRVKFNGTPVQIPNCLTFIKNQLNGGN